MVTLSIIIKGDSLKYLPQAFYLIALFIPFLLVLWIASSIYLSIIAIVMFLISGYLVIVSIRNKELWWMSILGFLIPIGLWIVLIFISIFTIDELWKIR
jgi:ABC-type microcin C transport system permease subunit YejE